MSSTALIQINAIEYIFILRGIEVPNSIQLVILGGHGASANGLFRVQVYSAEGAKERLAVLNKPRI